MPYKDLRDFPVLNQARGSVRAELLRAGFGMPFAATLAAIVIAEGDAAGVRFLVDRLRELHTKATGERIRDPHGRRRAHQ